MKTFKQFLEISLNLDAPGIEKSNKSFRSSSSNLLPSPEKTFIVPIRISYGIYNVLNKYSRNFSLASAVLLRRGDSVDFVTVNASNQEIANLKDLAEYVKRISNKEEEIRTADSALDSVSSAIDQKV